MGQIPGANQYIERQEVALQKQMHMSVCYVNKWRRAAFYKDFIYKIHSSIMTYQLAF